MEAITAFLGQYGFLSNFFIEPDMTNVEAEFQSEKSPDSAIKESIRREGPLTAKRLGRQTLLRHDWEDIKDSIMWHYVYKKFLDHPDLAEQLVMTGSAHIIEGNNWGDKYWGQVYINGNWHGKNKLGIILMDVRTAL